MLYAQYLRIETKAGGCGCTVLQFARAAHTLLSKAGKSRAQRTVRHTWLREAFAELAESRTLYRYVVTGGRTPANPGLCCKQCGAGLDFGCRCPDY